MHKSALLMLLINFLVSNQSEAAQSSNTIKSVKSITDVCEITHHSGFFALDATVFGKLHDGYSEHCERIGMTRTSARDRSSLVIEADGFDKKQWETVTLTLNVDNQQGDIHAEAALREATYKLIGSQAQNANDKAKAYNLAYDSDFFEKIKSGDYMAGIDFLENQVSVTIDSSFSRRGGEKIVLQMYRI